MLMYLTKAKSKTKRTKLVRIYLLYLYIQSFFILGVTVNFVTLVYTLDQKKLYKSK